MQRLLAWREGSRRANRSLQRLLHLHVHRFVAAVTAYPPQTYHFIQFAARSLCEAAPAARLRHQTWPRAKSLSTMFPAQPGASASQAPGRAEFKLAGIRGKMASDARPKRTAAAGVGTGCLDANTSMCGKRLQRRPSEPSCTLQHKRPKTTLGAICGYSKVWF
jgi:hypothetical protein